MIPGESDIASQRAGYGSRTGHGGKVEKFFSSFARMPALADGQHWTSCYWRIRLGFCGAFCLIRRLRLPGSDNILRVPVISGSERGREAHGDGPNEKARERVRLAGFGIL
jgi:hypothetical protein